MVDTIKASWNQIPKNGCFLATGGMYKKLDDDTYFYFNGYSEGKYEWSDESRDIACLDFTGTQEELVSVEEIKHNG